MCTARVLVPLLLPLVGLLSLSDPVAAARCEEIPPTPQQVVSAVRAGFGLAEFLDQSGAEIALVARVGTDQSKRGIRYTHAALSWRDHPQGRWHVVHLLNHCGEPTSQLFDDGPVNFFLERPFSYDALVVLPTAELQRRVTTLLRAGVARSLHDPDYSAIAHPFHDEYQNSNQWLLELLALAMEEEGVARDRRAAQTSLRRHGFVPARMRLGFFERVGARRMDNVSLADHRRSELRRGGYQWVSVMSVVDYLEARGHVLLRTELLAQ